MCIMDKEFTKTKMRHVKNKWRKWLISANLLPFTCLLENWHFYDFLLDNKCDIITSRRQEPSGTGITYMTTQPMETLSVTQSGCISLHYCHPFPKQQQPEQSMTTTQHEHPLRSVLGVLADVGIGSSPVPATASWSHFRWKEVSIPSECQRTLLKIFIL